MEGVSCRAKSGDRGARRVRWNHSSEDVGVFEIGHVAGVESPNLLLARRRLEQQDRLIGPLQAVALRIEDEQRDFQLADDSERVPPEHARIGGGCKAPRIGHERITADLIDDARVSQDASIRDELS
jgi:hypothetical protein